MQKKYVEYSSTLICYLPCELYSYLLLKDDVGSHFTGQEIERAMLSIFYGKKNHLNYIFDFRLLFSANNWS